jgi:hypothetical protein
MELTKEQLDEIRDIIQDVSGCGCCANISGTRALEKFDAIIEGQKNENRTE